MVITKVQCICLLEIVQSDPSMLPAQLYSCIKWIQLHVWWVLDCILQQYAGCIDLVISTFDGVDWICEHIGKLILQGFKLNLCLSGVHPMTATIAKLPM